MAENKINSINEDKNRAVIDNGKEIELSDSEFKVGESVVVREDGKGYHRLED